MPLVFAGSGYLEGKELQDLIQELQLARKKAGLVGLNLFRRGKKSATLNCEYSSVSLKRPLESSVFQGMERCGRERSSGRRGGRKRRGRSCLKR